MRDAAGGYFRDPRYIRIEGRPVLLVYHAELLPDAVTLTRLARSPKGRKKAKPSLLRDGAKLYEPGPAQIRF